MAPHREIADSQQVMSPEFGARLASDAAAITAQSCACSLMIPMLSSAGSLIH
jgi:hypothetical protein